MVAVDDVLRRHALGFCFYGDGHPVLVTAADKGDVAAVQAQETRVNVCRDVNSGKVSDVDWPVGIGQCGSYKGAFVFFFHRSIFSNHKDTKTHPI